MALESSLRQIACPCLLLAGRHDQMRPPAQVERYARLLRRAELAIIDSGHIMVVQAPDAVAEKMRTFFLRQ